MRYLFASQETDGTWLDFELAVGYSTYWTSAYVGSCLAGARPSLDPVNARYAESAITAAADFLQAHCGEGGLWGFNGQVVPDCDSSSWAITFLTACGRTVTASSYAGLARFKRADGGFATYTSVRRADGSESSWTRSHPDVTPIAIRALKTQMNELPVADESIRYMQRSRDETGLWQSFWYKSPLYSTLQNIITMLDCCGIVPSLTPEMSTEIEAARDDAFELAMALEIALLCGDGDFESSFVQLLQSLLDAQLIDGRWMAQRPMLRQTDDGVREPWAIPDREAGELFFDERCNFTTATVVELLSHALRTGDSL